MAHSPRPPTPGIFEMSKRALLLFAAAAGTLAVIFKRQRDRELDEAIWEEPHDV